MYCQANPFILNNYYMNSRHCCHHHHYSNPFGGALGLLMLTSMFSNVFRPGNYNNIIPMPQYNMPFYYPQGNFMPLFQMPTPQPVIDYSKIFDNNYNNFLMATDSKRKQHVESSTLDETSVKSKETKVKETETNQPVKDTGKLDKNFLNKVKQVANNLNCDYKDLLAIINSESGFDPRAGAGSSYIGLIQFGDLAIQELRDKAGCTGLTKEKILNMSRIEQLDLVEKYLKIAKGYTFSANARLSGGDLYAIVFAPGRAGNEVLYRKGEAGYNSINSKIDYNNDGKITKTEMSERIRRKHVNESIFA